MNFEHLITFLKKKQTTLLSRKTIGKLRKLLIFYASNLNLKLKKLKLGSVSFELKHLYFSGICLYETLEMKYNKQDQTNENELNVENRLQSLKWKWNFQNVVSFLVVAFVFLNILLFYTDLIFKDVFYAFYDTEKFNSLFTFSINSFIQMLTFLFKNNSLFLSLNELMFKTLLDLTLVFNFF